MGSGQQFPLMQNTPLTEDNTQGEVIRRAPLLGPQVWCADVILPLSGLMAEGQREGGRPAVRPSKARCRVQATPSMLEVTSNQPEKKASELYASVLIELWLEELWVLQTRLRVAACALVPTLILSAECWARKHQFQQFQVLKSWCQTADAKLLIEKLVKIFNKH